MIRPLSGSGLDPGPEQSIINAVRRIVRDHEGNLLRFLSGERVRTYFNIWRNNMESIYGKEVLEAVKGDLPKLFIDLTIYTTVLKVLGSTILESMLSGDKYTIPVKLSMEGWKVAVEMFWERKALLKFNVNYLFERDEYDWVFDPNIAPQLDKFFRDIGRELSAIDWSQRISVDLLKRIYQNIVSRNLRRQLGEYYTPDWLAKLILWRALHILVRGRPPQEVLVVNIDDEIVELINEYYVRHGSIPRFIDPTCGSFTFGVQYLNALITWYSKYKPQLNLIDFIKKVLDSVIGIDLNPVATVTAKVNYLLQIYQLLTMEQKHLIEEPIIPIYRLDLIVLHEAHMRKTALDAFFGRFDLVLGNLPWVNVSKYPENYRRKLMAIADELQVSPPKKAAKKLDISIILFAISAKYLLSSGGVIGLMIPTSVFRGLHGTSWRDFPKAGLRIFEVFDLEDVKPFEGTENQPGIVLAQKLPNYMSSPQFKFIKFSGLKLTPKTFNGKEPYYEDVLSQSYKLNVDVKDYVLVKFKETLWLSVETYNKAKNILIPKHVFYEAHEGVTFTAAKGAWLIEGKPDPINCPPGVPGSCVRVRTKLSNSLGLNPFIVEEEFIFKGFKGEDVEVGRIKNYRYFIAAYDREGNPLTEEKLKQTLLWKNYLSQISDRLVSVSKHFREKPWHIERMRSKALAQYKVVWRDVANKFIPAIVTDGSIPDYTVNYIVVESLEEAYYLLAILLAPQINAVVQELSPWVGHVQPRFIRYFKIPKFDSKNEIHRKLAEIGEEIYRKGEVSDEQLGEIEKYWSLVEVNLVRKNF